MLDFQQRGTVQRMLKEHRSEIISTGIMPVQRVLDDYRVTAFHEC